MPLVCFKSKRGKYKPQGLFMSQCKWKELEDFVTRNERLAKQAAENARELQERKDLSAKMQSEWDNTYVNMRKKRFEEMEARRVMAEVEREKKYWQLRREEQELREIITGKARFVLSQERDCNKSINRALVLAETLRERNAQVEFNNQLKQKELERELEYANSIREDVKMFEEEENAKKSKGNEKSEKLKEERLKMLHEAEERKMKEALDLKMEGQEELKRLAKEIKEEEEKEKQMKLRQKELSLANIADNLKLKEDNEKRFQRMMEEEDKKILIVSEGKKLLNNARKKRDKEAQAAAVERRTKIAQSVAAEAADMETAENERIQKAIAERDALSDKNAKDKEAYVQKLRKERIDAYHLHLEEVEKKRQDDYELAKWNMLQRFKKDEAIWKYENDVARKARDKMMNSKVMWKDQIRERQEKEQREIEEDVDALNRANQLWRTEDEEFTKYAQDMLEECKKVGRPTYPIEVALKNYKKSIGVLPQRPLSATWRSNIPIFNPAVEEEAEKRQINRPRIQPKCSCIPRNGI